MASEQANLKFLDPDTCCPMYVPLWNNTIYEEVYTPLLRYISSKVMYLGCLFSTTRLQTKVCTLLDREGRAAPAVQVFSMKTCTFLGNCNAN